MRVYRKISQNVTVFKWDTETANRIIEFQKYTFLTAAIKL